MGGELDPGALPARTELWNGSSWTEVNDMNTGRKALSEGTTDTTASLAFGGRDDPAPHHAITEDWNGASWSEVGDLNTARYDLAGAGNSTNGLAFGGNVPPATGATEEWTVPSTTIKVLTD